MTGRAAGYCTGGSVPGFMNRPGGGAWGRGGGGRGRRRCYYATGLPGWMRGGGFGAPGFHGAPYTPAISREQELEMLREQAKFFSDSLEAINARLDELSAGEA